MNPLPEILVTSGFDAATISATNEARNQRDELLAVAKKGIAVNSASTAKGAADFLIEVKGFTRSIEEARKIAKAPIIELGKQIDRLAEELTAELDNEANRISRMLGTYQQEQKRLEEEERRKAWEKEQAIIREANRVAEENRRKLAEEQEALRLKEERARTEKGRLHAEQTRAEVEERARLEAESHRQKVEDEIIANRVAASAVSSNKPEGISTSDEIMFEVTDIVALYEANPAFVTLTPQRAAIKNAIKSLRTGQTLPGLRHWLQPKTVVRG